MFGRYGEYKEITKTDDSIWRIAFPEENNSSDLSLGVCSKYPNQNDFVSTTPAGTFTIKVPNKTSETLSEVYKIIKKIEINN